VALLILLIGTFSIAAGRQSVGAEALPLEELLRAVKVALADAQTRLETQKLLKLESVTLEVKAIQKQNAEGGFSFWIVEAGAGQSQEVSDSITLELTPPAPGSDIDVAASDLSDRLLQAILAGVPAVELASEGNPKLLTKTMSVGMNFVVTNTAGGKLGLAFPPFSVSAGGEVSQAMLNSIIVKYKGLNE
jgi:hypothetical protein